MEGSYTNEEIMRRMEEMRDEIATLKAALAAKASETSETAETERAAPDMRGVRHMFEEGFERMSEALRPLVEEADRKIGGSARHIVAQTEEHIGARPFTSVALALGAGLLIGRLLDARTRPER